MSDTPAGGNDDRSGTERAAILLLTLGEHEAAQVLKHMGAREVQKIGAAMAQLQNVSREEVSGVLSSFSDGVGRQTSVGVGVDEFLGGGLRHADVLCQRERRLAVEQRIVDDLCAAPKLVFVEPAHPGEDALGRAVVDVNPPLKRLDQGRITRQVRQHSKFDLRVVGGNQAMAGLGDERRTDVATERGPNRDVLKIRVLGRKPSGRGVGLVKSGM